MKISHRLPLLAGLLPALAGAGNIAAGNIAAESNSAESTASKTAAAEIIDYAHQESWHGVLDRAQSPINIVTSTAKPADPYEPRQIILRYVEAEDGVAEDNGHAIQFNTRTTQAWFRGRHFQLSQLHFHASSEHTIDGHSFPLEGHFVFKAEDGRLAVMGVMYQLGDANPAIQAILDGLAATRHEAHSRIDIGALIPKTRDYYHYLGSLTTPPLTQNVEWYVMQQPLTLSNQQLATFRKHYSHNNRKIQPLYDRPIIKYDH